MTTVESNNVEFTPTVNQNCRIHFVLDKLADDMTKADDAVTKESEGKVNVSVIAATTTPCDTTLSRSLLIYVNDEEKAVLPIHCVRLSDAGICVDAKPSKPGKYTLNLSYTFEVKEAVPVEAKMLLLDGRFGSGGESVQLKRNEDESWSTDGQSINESLIVTTTTTTTTTATEVVEKPVVKRREQVAQDVDEDTFRRVSLSKQMNRPSAITELVGEKDITRAARRLSTLEEVTAIIKKAGLKSGNLIFGIDYTASNRTQGQQSFGGKSLHSIDISCYNPYQQVISILGKTLESFSDQAFIPAYGFGDFKTSDHSVFPIQGPEGPCETFKDVLQIYNTMTPRITLSGPTNFAPIIRQAIQIAQESPAYYLLVIVADGQVNNEPDTVHAIVEACKYPISIVVVGVGDGPWHMMNEFDERIPERTWDNFNFVNFHMVTHGEKNPEVTFAVHALSEVPDQFTTICRLGLLPGREVPLQEVEVIEEE